MRYTLPLTTPDSAFYAMLRHEELVSMLRRRPLTVQEDAEMLAIEEAFDAYDAIPDMTPSEAK